MSFLNAEVIEKCVQHLITCRQVLLFGMGASLCVAKDASLKFLRVNKTCFVMDDWHSQYLLAQNATADDFAVIFSYSGETGEMIKCAQQLKLSGTPGGLYSVHIGEGSPVQARCKLLPDLTVKCGGYFIYRLCEYGL